LLNTKKWFATGKPRLLLLALITATTTGCVASEGFYCASNTQCGTEVGGTCEASGFCSFPDPACASGRRYGTEAGEVSSACTDIFEQDASPLGGIDAGAQPDTNPAAPDADPAAPDADPSAPDANPAVPDAGSVAVDAGEILVDFVPSNLPGALLTSASNALTLQASDGEVEINSDTGAITRMSDYADLMPIGVGFTTLGQGAGNPDIGVFSVTGLSVESGVTVQVVGTAALAFAVAGNVDIAGVIEASGGRAGIDVGGPGGFFGGKASACDGKGPGGGQAGSAAEDVGGGGAAHLALGGAGGARAAVDGGSSGATYGVNALIPLVGGSGGGCGGGTTPRARGGGGGGAIQLSARGTIRVAATGRIDVGAGGGGGGAKDNGGGGGGSGGAVLLEGGQIVIAGVVAANGGGGGAGSNDTLAGNAGQSGNASAVPASGGVGDGEGTSGGAGGAGAAGAGGVGGSTSGTTGSDNAGGGGGSAGRLRLRCDYISRPGTVSPISGLSESGL